MTGEEFFLEDHRVRGEKTLPGVAYLEMARAAAEIAGKQPVVQFRNIIWASPIVIKDKPAEIQVSLYPDETGEVSYEIRCAAGNNRPAIHAQGKLNFGNKVSLGDAPMIDLKAIRERCTEKPSPAECYHQFRQKGLEYGPDFQPIAAITGHSREALARLRLPPRLREEKNAYGLHPSLMDGALQTIIGMKLSQLNGADSKLYLPFAAQEVRLYGPFPDEAYVYVTYSADTGATGSPDPKAAIVKYDIVVADEQGQVRLFFKEFTVRAVPAQPKPEVDRKTTRPVYCIPAWRVKPIAEGDGEREKMEQTNLLLLMVAGLPQSLVKSIGTRFKQAKVIELAPEPGSDIANQVTALTLTMWDQLKAVAEKKPGTQTRIVVLAPETDQRYLYAPLAGLLKSARLEHPKIQGKVVTVVNPVADSLMSILSREIRLDTFGDGEVRYDETGTRQIKSLKEIELESSNQRRTYLRPGGVYWITGGLGGLGQIFARHLAEYGEGITLILSGRSPLDDAGQARLANLGQPGVRIDYLQADVSRRDDVERIVQSIKAHYGTLNGIIHSAGVIRDSFILKKTVAEIEAVLAPKVAGTVNIDLATQTEALDFLVLFSSVSGVTGNVGQSIYAAANAFMDEYARHRQGLVETGQRSGRTLTINWPLWQDGGMQLDEETKKWLVNRTGIMPLATSLGLQAFEWLLAQQQYVQMAVIQGEAEKIRRNLALDHVSTDPSPSLPTRASESVQATAGELTVQLEEGLIDLCVELLKVKRADLDVETEFLEYGVDSILMMSMLNKLEEKYGLSIDPNAILENPTIRSFAGYLASLGVTGQAVSQPNLLPQERRQPDPRLLEQEVPEVQAISRLSKPRSKSRARFSQGASRLASGKVAIIGQACHLPQSPTVDHFWDNLAAGRDLVTNVPAGRWPAEDVYSPNNGYAAGPYFGGFIDKIAYFDAKFFNISDEQAITMDPQQRFMLELAQTLLDSAGYSPQDIVHTNTSIFIGGKDNNYVRNFSHLIPEMSLQHSVVNSISNMIAARISDFYDLTGTSQMIDTACSSSLVAVHDACQSILRGESALAIAGGIHLMVDAYAHIGFSQARVLSDDGKSYVFDERAKGFVLGEGGGLVMLKQYEAALRDGDQILGVILGSAVNNDGKTMGVTVPNQAGQKAVIEAAIKRSGLTPDLIRYLEAHGTGTLLGDPIEIRAATEVYRQYTQARQYCAVGSVKSNLGHTMTAAGITGLTKLILSLQHQQIPATLHCEKPHPRFGFKESPFYPNTGLRDWEPKNGRRVGAISSFGFGGTNCHMIVEEGNQTHQIRRPLPPTQFKRKRYWLGKPIVPEEKTSERAYHAQLLDQLDRGEIDEQKIEALIFANRH